MSGCCGQGPVIVSSGAAATPRVEVETVLLCDVQADGTVAATVMVEPIYDTSSGARVGTRIVDPVTGASYTPTGTLTVCGGQEGAVTVADVETWPLCVIDTSGTVLQHVRAEQVYDETGAASGPPRLVDAVTGLPVAIPGGATIGVCPEGQPCDSLTTPTATVGLCLADGTPIAVTVVRDCAGAVAQEGWINLATGTFSAGPPPAGTVACGDSRSVQVSGTFCDVDQASGDVLGLVLIEYTYAADGTIASVRLVDAVTGQTYTPTGTVTTCPVGVEQPEQDVVQLCDVQADGTSVPMIRDYRRDETGTVVGHTDYTLDGTPYTPTGTVGECGRELVCYQGTIDTLEDCTSGTLTPLPTPALPIASSTVAANPNNFTVTDLAASHDGSLSTWTTITLDGNGQAPGLVLRYDLAAPGDLGYLALRNQYGGIVTDNDGIGAATLTVYSAAGAVLWSGPLYAGNGGAEYVTTFGGILRGAAYFTLSDISRIAGTTLTTIGWRELTAVGPYRARITWDCPGQDLTAAVEGARPGLTYDGTTLVQSNGPHTLTFSSSAGSFDATLNTNNPAAWSALSVSDASPSTVLSGDGTLTLAASAATNGAQLRLGWLNPDGSVTDVNTGTVVDAPRLVPCGGGEAATCQDAETVTLCDTAPDGTVTTFLRRLVHDCTGTVTSATDTALDGVTPYAPTGTVGVCAADSCARQIVERCGCDDTTGDGLGDVQYTELWAVDPCNGGPPVLLGTYEDGDLTRPYSPASPVECTAAEALPGPLSTGVRNVTGTAVQDLAAAFPGLQSVSLTVLAGTVNVTMSDGAAVPVPAGASLTWSVEQASDTALAVASFAGASAAASYLLNWTFR
ncbi:hypothetical protein H114_32764 [Streptomyces gancidicus BKS 13-15]|uniref:Uncharacterized protein n=1 Tax=Streptomyces gancidicus BKS 13-15 TaxID=1284664 RepID=M3B9K7_STREZ|nr:hypothetical protein [Streptomyces gancidicus]EMF20414.1 hypothetical protein H114_32764 [Streptomyces gancidicus BKS 13-15]